MRPTAIGILVAIPLAALVMGCEQEPPPASQQLRPIRAFTVTEVATGQLRRFSGLIEASDSSSLSFQVSGNVREVRVSQGDTVRAGQVLATLDQEPYQLNVQAAQADLERARAYLAQARTDYERHQRLLQQRAVAQAQFEVAQRNYQASLSQVDFNVARVDLARRDLRHTTLIAPFDGSVAARLVDPFVQIQAGQELFRIDAAGNRQAAIVVPETTIAYVTIGMSGTVNLPQMAQPVQARVTEIGSAASAGNAFPVKLTLLDPPADVRPGMTAEVSLLLPHAAAETTYLIPLSAIAPGDRPGTGAVFVFDPPTSTVRRTVVTASGPLASNMVAVNGVALGDILVTAGVNFLVDGQKVRLMEQPIEAARR